MGIIIVYNGTVKFGTNRKGNKPVDKLKLKEYSEKLVKFHRDISGFYNDYAKSVGLTYASLGVLGIILNEENCTQTTITQHMCLPKQTINAIIKSFNKHGIIEPPVESDSDKRNKVIILTGKGKDYAEKIMSKVQEAEYAALDSLGEERCKNLIQTIAMYKDSLKIK